MRNTLLPLTPIVEGVEGIGSCHAIQSEDVPGCVPDAY